MCFPYSYGLLMFNKQRNPSDMSMMADNSALAIVYNPLRFSF